LTVVPRLFPNESTGTVRKPVVGQSTWPHHADNGASGRSVVDAAAQGETEMRKMFSRSRWLRHMALLALVGTALGCLGDGALAAQRGERVVFGPIGVARHEGVRVNVYAIGNPDISDPNDVPWDFVLRIFNRSGQVVSEQRLQLAPGVTGSVEVNIGNPDIFPPDRLGRRTLRAEIVGFNPQPDPPGAYFATLEVYNLVSGSTSVLLGGPDTLPAPPQ
jgi:hypothetical protein